MLGRREVQADHVLDLGSQSRVGGQLDGSSSVRQITSTFVSASAGIRDRSVLSRNVRLLWHSPRKSRLGLPELPAPYDPPAPAPRIYVTEQRSRPTPVPRITLPAASIGSHQIAKAGRFFNDVLGMHSSKGMRFHPHPAHTPQAALPRPASPDVG